MKKHNILVVGAGSIGARHIKNLLSLGQQVSAVDSNKNVLKKRKGELSITIYSNVRDAYEKAIFDIVFICTPAHTHVALAMEALKHDAHVFIEKPLSVSVKGLAALRRFAEEKSKVVMVACNYRFHPGFLAVKGMLQKKTFGNPIASSVVLGYDVTQSRKETDYRKTYVAKGEQGGGVIFDSGAHVVDYLTELFGEVTVVWATTKVLRGLQLKTESYASGSLEHASGVTSVFELDYVGRPKRHRVGVLCEKGIIEWNFVENSVSRYDEKTGRLTTTDVYNKRHSPEIERNDMYLKEVVAFLEAISKHAKNHNDIASGWQTVKTLHAIQKSSASQKQVRPS